MSKRSSLSMYVIATVFCSNFHFSVSLHVPFSQFLFERDSYSNKYLVFSCKFWRLYSRERASQSLLKISQKFEAELEKIQAFGPWFSRTSTSWGAPGSRTGRAPSCRTPTAPAATDPEGSRPFLANFRQNFARFRLYRRRFLQANTRFSAFFKIYQII